jgi:hypothetical protein
LIVCAQEAAATLESMPRRSEQQSEILAMYDDISSRPLTIEKENSGQRESNPHSQLGRLELYH